MQLKTTVKVGEVNNLSDARYCAGMGVQMIGFNITPDTPGYLNPESFKEITEWLEGTQFIGELNGANSALIEKSLKEYALTGIQVDVNSDTDLAADFEGVKILKLNFSDSIETLTEQINNHPEFDYYLIDSDFKLNIKEEAFASLSSLTQKDKILLGTGISIDNVDAILDSSGVGGIHLKGGTEERPGWVDLDELADFLEHLEVEI